MRSSESARVLPAPCLMLVTDRALVGGVEALVAGVIAAVDGGVNVIQVREKDLPRHEQVALARLIAKAVRGRALVVLNGSHADALAAGADGVHLPEHSASEAVRRDNSQRGVLVGRSVHSVAAAVAATRVGADYLVLGTIFPSRSHPDGEPGGIGRVAAVTSAVSVPVVAIGGVTAENVCAIVESGAAGVAVISAILGADDIRAAAEQLRTAVSRAWVLAGAPRGDSEWRASTSGVR